MPAARVLVVTATYNRPAGLRALLESLGTAASGLAGALVVNNGDPAQTGFVAKEFPAARVVTAGRNLGCGGGVALGLAEMLRDAALTHAWIFDDDALATPGALEALLEALEAAKADAAVPLMTDAAGRIGWFPGPLAQPAWSVIREPGMTPEKFRQRCGTAPLAWNWAPWPSLIVTRRAVETVGVPRDDYWFQGEDLEWTLRLSARFAAVLAPAAVCRHILPAGDDREREFRKQALMLQNNFFTSTRLEHGRRLLRHAPGNVYRFLRANRFSGRALQAAALGFWRGAVRGGPAGRPKFDGFRLAWEQRSAPPAAS